MLLPHPNTHSVYSQGHILNAVILSWLDNWFTNIRSSSVLIESVTIIEKWKTNCFKNVNLFNTHLVWAWDSRKINNLNILRYHQFTNWACLQLLQRCQQFFFFHRSCKKGCSTGLETGCKPILFPLSLFSLQFFHTTTQFFTFFLSVFWSVFFLLSPLWPHSQIQVTSN